MAWVESHQHYAGGYARCTRQNPEGELHQTDWDWPSLAQAFGWSLARVQRRQGRTVELLRRSRTGCQHESTDGTVDCRDCGVTATEFITAASNYLDDIAR